MSGLPLTQPTLLIRMRDATDHDAWNRFTDLYAPVVYSFLRKRGLQDADAADLSQDVLRQVSTSINAFHYDANRGSFRNWILTIVQNRLSNYWRRDAHQARSSGDPNVIEQLQQIPQPTSPNDETLWDADYQRQLFHYAARIVRQDFTIETWQAFWQTAVDGRLAKDVASELDLTLAAVYLAKARVMKRIKGEVARLIEEEYGDN